MPKRKLDERWLRLRLRMRMRRHPPATRTRKRPRLTQRQLWQVLFSRIQAVRVTKCLSELLDPSEQSPLVLFEAIQLLGEGPSWRHRHLQQCRPKLWWVVLIQPHPEAWTHQRRPWNGASGRPSILAGDLILLACLGWRILRAIMWLLFLPMTTSQRQRNPRTNRKSLLVDPL